MATYPAKGGNDFVKAPEGTHLAVSTLIADVGLQPGSGAFPDPKQKIYVRWELPGERVEIDGKDLPQIIYANYTASMNAKANLRKMVESWRGKAMTDQEAELFDVRNLLGKTCMLQIVHSADGQYANVKNVMAPPKGTKPLKPEGTTVYYGTDDDSQFDALPAFLRKKVEEQLDPHVAKPPPTLNQPSVRPTQAGRAGSARSTTTTSATTSADEQEASRQAAREAALATGDPDDEIPF